MRWPSGIGISKLKVPSIQVPAYDEEPVLMDLTSAFIEGASSVS